MMSKAKQATKAEKNRFDEICRRGCICCIKDGVLLPPDGEVNHIIDGSKRKGHSFTYSICPYHHRGVPFDGYTDREMEEIFGPSLAKNGKAFRKRYGNDAELLSFQEELLKQPVTR